MVSFVDNYLSGSVVGSYVMSDVSALQLAKVVPGNQAMNSYVDVN
jgi:hypothetical protein